MRYLVFSVKRLILGALSERLRNRLDSRAFSILHQLNLCEKGAGWIIVLIPDRPENLSGFPSISFTRSGGPKHFFNY